MLIIIEGPDGAGKTTFAGMLGEQLDWPVLHKGPPTADLVEEYMPPTDRPNYVVDRFHLGEFVYGPLFRNRFYEPSALSVVERRLRQAGALLVLLTGDADWLGERLIGKGESPNLSELHATVGLFDHAFEQSRLPKIKRVSPVSNFFLNDVMFLARCVQDEVMLGD